MNESIGEGEKLRIPTVDLLITTIRNRQADLVSRVREWMRDLIPVELPAIVARERGRYLDPLSEDHRATIFRILEILDEQGGFVDTKLDAPRVLDHLLLQVCRMIEEDYVADAVVSSITSAADPTDTIGRLELTRAPSEPATANYTYSAENLPPPLFPEDDGVTDLPPTPCPTPATDRGFDIVFTHASQDGPGVTPEVPTLVKPEEPEDYELAIVVGPEGYENEVDVGTQLDHQLVALSVNSEASLPALNLDQPGFEEEPPVRVANKTIRPEFGLDADQLFSGLGLEDLD